VIYKIIVLFVFCSCFKWSITPISARNTPLITAEEFFCISLAHADIKTVLCGSVAQKVVITVVHSLSELVSLFSMLLLLLLLLLLLSVGTAEL